MQPLLAFPRPLPVELAQALDMAGRDYVVVNTEAEVSSLMPEQGWGGAIIVADLQAENAWAMCRALRRSGEKLPIVVLVNGRQLDDLADRESLYDDFCITPFHPRELERRIGHSLFVAGTDATAGQLVSYGPLVLNVDTYQAAIDGEAMDLTHMEYELLKFLAANPGKVFTREVLLSRVWGYDYFGGARTVDVHIRRLRSKLGERHASMIQTVRSVGYSLGESAWSS